MLLWIPLAFLVVSLVGSVAWAAVHGWRLWQVFKRVSDKLSGEVGRLAEKSAATEERATAAAAGAERLTAAAERLQVSLAQLAVLRAAFAESRSAFGSVRGTVPRK